MKCSLSVTVNSVHRERGREIFVEMHILGGQTQVSM